MKRQKSSLHYSAHGAATRPEPSIQMSAAIPDSDIDTDIVSMLFKGDTRVFHFRKHIVGRLLGISFMSLAEQE
jgi:hypothetical protein